MGTEKSAALFEEALRYIPGGVNSPVRAFRSVGTHPIFVDRAQGSKLWDCDGNCYIDYITSWGPMILGHCPEQIGQTISRVASKGTSFGLPTSVEVEMAREVTQAYPAIDMVRMVNSGTEATMSAIRVARGYTHRDKIIKFEGCYHGHNDGMLVSCGSGALTFQVPTSPGVPAAVVQDTIVCRYNDLQDVEAAFARYPGQIAGVIVEPVAANMGVVPPKEGFLQGLRQLTAENGAVLIFDEVITGFRLGLGGASQRYGVAPDMACFGKIIGAGLPVGAYGGRREIMEMVSPAGPVYQAGTLSGNPLAMSLGLEMLRELKAHPEIYTRLEEKAACLEAGFAQNIAQVGLPCTLTRVGSLLCLFFTEGPVEGYDQVRHSDTKKFAAYFASMLAQGVLIAPSQFEAMFVSAAHTQEDLEHTIAANRIALEAAAQA